MSLLLTRERLQKLAPRAKPEVFDAIVSGIPLLEKAGITTPIRLRHALAQWAYETNGFTEWEENLHYSASRLLEIFPHYFTAAQARLAAAAGPQAIANRVYDDRNPARINRLGNTRPGDGWRYRGRGIMHSTGGDAYRRASVVTGVDLLAHPERLADPALSLVVACDYWLRRGCNKFADRDCLEAITRIINGGRNGLDGRAEYLARAEKIWPDGAWDVTRALAPSVIQEGSSGSDVLAAQQRLISLGYPLAADGVYGPLMRGVVLRFKADNGIKFTDQTTDDLDAATLAALHDPATHPADVGTHRLEAPQVVAAAEPAVRAASKVATVGKTLAGGGLAAYVGLQDAVTGSIPDMLTNVQSWVGTMTGAAAFLKAAPWAGLIILGVVIWRAAIAIKQQRAADVAQGQGGH